MYPNNAAWGTPANADFLAGTALNMKGKGGIYWGMRIRSTPAAA